MLCLIYVYDWIYLTLKCLHTRLYVCVYLDSVCIIIYSATSSATCSDCVAGKYSRYVSSTSTCAPTITATHMLILYMLLILLIDIVSVYAFCCWIHWCESRYFVLLSSKLLTHLCYAWYMSMTESIYLWYASILDCIYVCTYGYVDSVCIIIYSATGATSSATCSDCVAGKYSGYVFYASTCTPSITSHMLIL